MTNTTDSLDTTAVLTHLLHANQLKRTTRTGWAMRGIPNAEDVAAHSFGVVYAAMVLAQLIPEPPDMGRLLAMAALHDLPEALTTDIPQPAVRYLPPNSKLTIERNALHEILDGVAFAPQFQEMWEELHAKETAVARLIDDADKLDLFLQAYIYEQHGHPQLAEFWTVPHTFYFPQAQALYDQLRTWRMG